MLLLLVVPKRRFGRQFRVLQPDNAQCVDRKHTRRYAGIMLLVQITIVLIAILHIYWGQGGCWPGRSREELMSMILGGPPGTPVTSKLACYTVAFGLLAAFRFAPDALRWVFAIRGVLGLLEIDLRPSMRGTPYERLSRWCYSPLCLLLAWAMSR